MQKGQKSNFDFKIISSDKKLNIGTQTYSKMPYDKNVYYMADYNSIILVNPMKRECLN